MPVLAAFNPLYALSGFAVGMLVGLTGVGGGSLMTPLLMLVFGIHPATAVGTDLLYAAATKTVGTGVHGFRGTIDWPIVARLAAGSVPATVATLFVLSHLERRLGAANHAITLILGVALMVTAVALFFRRTIVGQFNNRMSTAPGGRTTGLTVFLGAILGVLVSLSSVGAGAIGLTLLLMLYPNVPAGKLVGSDIAHAVPLTLIAGIGHWLMGTVDLGLLASLLTGSIPGIIIGSLMSSRIPDRLLRPILASALVLVGCRLVF